MIGTLPRSERARNSAHRRRFRRKPCHASYAPLTTTLVSLLRDIELTETEIQKGFRNYLFCKTT